MFAGKDGWRASILRDSAGLLGKLKSRSEERFVDWTYFCNGAVRLALRSQERVVNFGAARQTKVQPAEKDSLP